MENIADLSLSLSLPLSLSLHTKGGLGTLIHINHKSPKAVTKTQPKGHNSQKPIARAEVKKALEINNTTTIKPLPLRQ